MGRHDEVPTLPTSEEFTMKRPIKSLSAALASSVLLIGIILISACNNPFGGDNATTSERPAKQWLPCDEVTYTFQLPFRMWRQMPEDSLTITSVDTFRTDNLDAAQGLVEEVWLIAEAEGYWFSRRVDIDDPNWHLITNGLPLICFNDTEANRSLIGDAVSARGDTLLWAKSRTSTYGDSTYNRYSGLLEVNCRDAYAFSSTEPLLETLRYYNSIGEDIAVGVPTYAIPQ